MNAETQAYITSHRELSAEELSARLRADFTTPRAIPRSGLNTLLAMSGLWRRFPATKAHPYCPVPLREGIEDYEFFLTTANDLNTADSQIAAKVAALLQGLTQFRATVGSTEVGFTVEEVDAIYALGGGRRLEGLAAETVQEELDRLDAAERSHNLRAQAGAVYNRAVALIDNGETDLAAAFATALLEA